MKIVVDENITFAKETFSQFGKVELYNGREISNSVLQNADALITRSITEVNKALLKNTNVKFVGTATIGTDHVDLDYLKTRNIAFASAAGCNSWAVTEYVFSAISHLCSKHNLSLEDKSIGIIGVGNIGSKVAKISEALGLKVILNDPPLKKTTGDKKYKLFDEALLCDIVTLHVPLNLSGEDKTFHLLNENNIKQIKPGTILINTSRGAVINNIVLKNKLRERKNIFTVLDVWENEPDVDRELLDLIEIGTAHIAGYSFEGKVNGTKMIYDSLCDFVNEKKTWQPSLPTVEKNLIRINLNDEKEKVLEEIFKKSYEVKIDNMLLRNSNNGFDQLRKKYKHRRELLNYKIKGSELNTETKKLCEAFRIKII